MCREESGSGDGEKGEKWMTVIVEINGYGDGEVYGS